MKLISFSAGLFILINTNKLTNSFSYNYTSAKEFDDFGLTTVEIIEKYGYPAETHQTVTEDGYILVLHRIPHGRNSTKPGFPILLAHSLFMDSALYVLNGKKSLGFFLADEGFDVWLTNFRGTHYTKAHKNLSIEDSKFWDFSLHEFGVYDLPALVDYICNCTNNEDLLYLGFSMGATNFFIMASERPEYQNKIRGAALLAPVATLKHSTAPIQFVLVPLMKAVTLLSRPHLLAVDAQDSVVTLQYIQKILKLACNSTLGHGHLCSYAMFALSGFDPEGFEERTIPNFVSHFSSTSSKVLGHFAQLFLTSKFRQYHYGTTKNLAIYKQCLPPEYHVKSTNTPISLFVSSNDIFCTPRNLLETFREVSSVKSIYVVPQKSFIHIDFVVGKYVDKILYPEIAKRLKEFISNSKVVLKENNIKGIQ